MTSLPRGTRAATVGLCVLAVAYLTGAVPFTLTLIRWAVDDVLAPTLHAAPYVLVAALLTGAVVLPLLAKFAPLPGDCGK